MTDSATKPKKKWEKPQLIVLVRSRPEEAVLLACKGGGQQSAVAKTSKNLCFEQIKGTCPAICNDNFPS
ncbi:MAG: hypothetical protein JXR49_00375 [Acidobacteria bacterium]|nr:hypothetical protein [Acidobacteriota bacterium]